MTSPSATDKIFIELDKSDAKLIAKVIAVVNHIFIDHNICIAIPILARPDTVTVFKIAALAIAGDPEQMPSLSEFDHHLRNGLIRLNRLAMSLMTQANPQAMAEARAELGLDEGHDRG